MENEKLNYSVINNFYFILKNMFNSHPLLTVFMFLRSPVMVVVPFLGIWMSRTVVEVITQGGSIEYILLTILWVSSALLTVSILNTIFNTQVWSFQHLHDTEYMIKSIKKAFTSDYEIMENPSGLNRFSKAIEVAGGDSSPSRILPDQFSSVIGNFIGIVTYAAILWILNPWIMLTILITTLSGFFVLKLSTNWVYKNKDNWKTTDRKLDYLFLNMGDFTRAKDIRLYSMSGWIGNLFTSVLKDRLFWYKKEATINLKMDFLGIILSLIRESIAYGFLVYLLYNRDMNAAEFVLYFGVIGGFSEFLNGIVSNIDSLNRIHLGICEYRKFIDYPDKTNRGIGAPLPYETFSIEFKNVCYRYTGNDEDTIKNLSFKINKGEKLAIVGINGAGKTTLVKLICGLYEPTSGVILVNDVPVYEYNIEEYHTLFSVVFQDVFLIPKSIACNISTLPEGLLDKDKLSKVIKLAGLENKINSLPNGINTMMVKSVYDDAVDFSGGEMQKLILARALYKDGLALILDEPTAALDPIAESNVYEEYNRISAKRTSVFISHRLASTRFCDRIFYLDNGTIVECGSHEELIMEQGKYHDMFMIQSHYYKEEVKAV